MSGGSYDYLYRQLDETADLERMAARLAELAPGSAAARDTATLAALLGDEKLRETWRAVEWLDSHDADDVAEAITAYEHTPEETP